MKIQEENGFALPSVLLISLLVLTMLLSILTITFFTNKGISKLYEKKRLELACYSAVQSTLTDSVLMFSDSVVVNINSTIVSMYTKQFGFWREIIAASTGTNDSVKVKCLIGIKGIEEGYFSNAIVITRPNLGATIVGNTEIVGDIVGTSDQIRTGNLFGESSVNQDYHKGSKKVDRDLKFQLIPDSLFEAIPQSFTNQNAISGNAKRQEVNKSNINQFVEGSQYNFPHSIRFSGEIKSKCKEPYKFKVDDEIEFTENTFTKTSLELFADSLIIIKKNCKLENILLYSNGPIIIEEGSSFKNVQLFSTDSISIKKAQFDYPSIICLRVNDTLLVKQNKALIIENSIINGSVILMTKNAGFSSNKSKIVIDSDSKVQGLVYSENNLEMKGKVLGTIYTYNFRYYKEPTEYINWLINVKVNREKLDNWFLLPSVFANQGKYKILKEEWIY